MLPEKTHPLYTPISDFYKTKFGEKVQKIPVSIADTCPNRLGLKGMQTCVFCDEWGSAAYPEQRGLSLQEQMLPKMQFLGARYRASAFLIYFQAYTSSFIAVKKLQAYFDEAVADPRVKGVVIGTRPDCLSRALLEFCKEFNEHYFVSIELGVQSFFDDQLAFLRRGHTAKASIDAIQKIKDFTPLDVGIHLMFGLPDETDEQLKTTAEIVSSLPIDHVKLHNLHVLKNTPLAQLYEEGKFAPISLEEYARRTSYFLEHLSPNIYVDRLVAVSSRWDELIAPEWCRYKMRSTQYILKRMREDGSYQGKAHSKTPS